MYKFPEFNSLVDLHLRTGQSGHALPTPDTAPVTSLSAAGPPQRPDKTPSRRGHALGYQKILVCVLQSIIASSFHC